MVRYCSMDSLRFFSQRVRITSETLKNLKNTRILRYRGSGELNGKEDAYLKPKLGLRTNFGQ